MSSQHFNALNNLQIYGKTGFLAVKNYKDDLDLEDADEHEEWWRAELSEIFFEPIWTHTTFILSIKGPAVQ